MNFIFILFKDLQHGESSAREDSSERTAQRGQLREDS